MPDKKDLYPQGPANRFYEREQKRAFYGRRAGPSLTQSQLALFDTLLPKISVDIVGKSDLCGADLFDHGIKELVLEIGFGGGEHLAHLAHTHPDIGYVGCEPFRNGMAKMLVATRDLGLKNVRLYHEDAIELMGAMASGQFDRIYLLYPDPWPKLRHHKRRFVTERSVGEIVRLLKPGGEWRFASDIENYVTWVFDHVERAPELEVITPKHEMARAWDGWVRTRYEEKAIKEGRVPHYVRFQKKA